MRARRPSVYADYETSRGKVKVVVDGKTYQLREKLKAAGFRWDPIERRWYLLTNINVEDRISPWSIPTVIEKLKTAGVEYLVARLPRDEKLIEKAGLKPISLSEMTRWWL